MEAVFFAVAEDGRAALGEAVTSNHIVGLSVAGGVSGSATGTGSFGAGYIGNKLGIGTTAPDYALDVAGNAGFNEYIYHNGDDNTYIQFGVDQIDFVVGAANMIYLNEGGAGDQADKVTINNALADVDFQVKGT